MTEDLTRRRLLGLAGASAAGVAGLGLTGCWVGTSSRPKVTPSATAPSGPPFVSRPDLTPPHITITRHGPRGDSRYIFLNAPYSGPGHGGTIIIDPHGEFVWFGPNTAAHHQMNFSVQTYQGRPVLTWYQGLVTGGFGRGELIIADSSYRILRVIQPAHGDLADFHEFVGTPQDTALITIYRGTRTSTCVRSAARPADTSSPESSRRSISPRASCCSNGTAGTPAIRPSK